MTIKEIEEQCGMTRANIRFYESEKLLSPERGANGYRNYSQSDLEALKRIKLLRTLHISLEEIKALQAGEQELADALDQHLARLELEKTDLEQSQEICKVMRGDGARYGTLDAQRYLDAMEQLTQQPVCAPACDAIPKVRAPWRRFFARTFDCYLYGMLWSVFLTLALNINIAARSNAEDLLDSLAAVAIMLFLEPALLARFGTTAGKWLLGLRVTTPDGRRLTYPDAFTRTFMVFFRGMGLNLPVYSLVRQWKSYKACDAGETLEWEQDSSLSLKDEKGWRTAACLGACAALFGVLALSLSLAEMPKHRGDITVAQFSENYNRLSDYYGVHTLSNLDENGRWVETENAGYVISIGGYDEPVYQFSESGGVMTGMRFSAVRNGSDGWAPGYQDEMILSVLSFVGAQKGGGPLPGETKRIVKAISESPFADFSLSACGVSIVCDVEYSGYMDTASFGTLLPEEGAQTSYSFSFSMQKQ